MKLADATWQDVQSFDHEAVVLIPTGSLEQHGPHLPLFTDSLLVTAVAEAVERDLGDKVVLTPTLWLGASGHHLKFPGTLSASFAAYAGALQSVVESLIPHGFTKFFALNGHGGNNEPNGIAMRELKALHPNLTFGHAGYYAFIEEVTAKTLTGPIKEMRHACEAEASLVMLLRPDLVRRDKMRNDGLRSDPPLMGLVHHFDEMTEEGSFGYATLANETTGKVLFEAAVAAVAKQIAALAQGYVLIGEPGSKM
ncbi:MAG TPA: creatininase family protein [Fimbriimonas sp.]|nr:creatininase family protein [Fimbriimonas sp.]